jgi:hypothetical protein
MQVPPQIGGEMALPNSDQLQASSSTKAGIYPFGCLIEAKVRLWLTCGQCPIRYSADAAPTLPG